MMFRKIKMNRGDRLVKKIKNNIGRRDRNNILKEYIFFWSLIIYCEKMEVLNQ